MRPSSALWVPAGSLVQPVGPSAPKPVFAVPQLLTNGHTMRERAFRLDTLQLVITYGQQSRQVYHVFLTTEYQRVGPDRRLLQVSNLAKDATLLGGGAAGLGGARVNL